MNRHSVTPNSTVFNFKNAFNGFLNDIKNQKFSNVLRNPWFTETRNGLVFAWSSVDVDLENPVEIDLDKKTTTFLFSGSSLIRQSVELSLDTEYTLILDCEIDSTNNSTTLNVASSTNTEDFVFNSQLVSIASVQVSSGISIIRFTTKDLAPLSPVFFEVRHANNLENANVTINSVSLLEGNLTVQHPEYLEIQGMIRWNNLEDYWEISTDNRVSWERILTDNNYFSQRISNITEAQLLPVLRQSNIHGGSGVIITPSFENQGGINVPILNISIDNDDLFESVIITSGDGLSGGGPLNNLSVLAVDNTVVRTFDAQTIAGSKTFSSTIIGSVSGSASQLTTARAINGVNFNGTIPITVPVNVTDNTTSTATFYPTLANGTSGNRAATVSSTKLSFVPSTGILSTIASSALYADLAEKYTFKWQPEVGSIVLIREDDQADCKTSDEIASDAVLGVVSTRPGLMMNSELEDGVYVALKGRVPAKVLGPVKKGEPLVSGLNGCAVGINSITQEKNKPGIILGKALETIEDNNEKIIEVVIL